MSNDEGLMQWRMLDKEEEFLRHERGEFLMKGCLEGSHINALG
jgi:hypothetical protein